VTKKIKVGIIGLGYIGKIHAQAYRSIPLSFPDAPVTADLRALWRTSLGRDETFIQSCGFETQTTDLDEFFKAPLDLVDVCTPTGFHTEFVNAAVEHGKAIYCEKPLGKNLADAKRMYDSAKKAGIRTRVAFVMRFVPAIRQMKSIIDAEELGRVLNFRAQLFHGSYLNPLRPMSWRLRFSQSGGGAFSDLGAHMLDLVRYLLGDVCTVRADMRTFIKERPTKAGSSEMEKVDVDDWTTCTLELENGVFGLVEAARTAPGVADDTVFQVFCEKGSLLYSARNPEALTLFDLDKNKTIQGVFKDIPRENERSISEIWPSGKTSMGYFLNAHLACQYDFMQNLEKQQPSLPDFRSALKVQAILEAAYMSAASGGKKITLPLL
jgi:predicted dehydrogenase